MIARYRYVIYGIFFLVLASFSLPARAATTSTVDAQQVPDQFYLGRVERIISQERDEDPNIPIAASFSQKVSVRLLNGPDAGQEIPLTFVLGSTGPTSNALKEGEWVIVVRSDALSQAGLQYYITERYRLPALFWIAGIFVALTLLFAGRRGIQSISGLIFTIAVLMVYVVPAILAGHNPLIVSLLGALLIAIVSLYLAHGFNYRTSVALVSTLLTIGIAVLSAVVFVHWSSLFGLGSEEAFFLQGDQAGGINLRGLLLGGIIIGVLGVLDDITTAQAAAVEELHNANPQLDQHELYHRGISVGREHITALVNTLALAYVGASFPLLLLFTQYQQPWWVTLNSEVIAEELVRTLVGSVTLIVAVPIATFLAARFFAGRPVDEAHVGTGHSHHHH